MRTDVGLDLGLDLRGLAENAVLPLFPLGAKLVEFGTRFLQQLDQLPLFLVHTILVIPILLLLPSTVLVLRSRGRRGRLIV